MGEKTGANEPPFTDKALNAIGEIFFVFTAEGKLLQWNRRVNEVTGYSDAEIAEMHPTEFVAAEDVDWVRRHIGKVFEEGRTRLEARYRTKDGREIPYEFTGSLLEHGGEKLICGIGRDITEKKEAKEALEESEAMFRVLAEHAQVGIGLVQDGVMKYVNPAYSEIFGYAPEELIGHPPTKFVHPDDHAHVEEQIQKRVEGREPTVRYEFKGLTKDGKMRRIEVHGSRITYRGKPAVIGTLLDVTERRRLQREVLRVQEEERRRLGQDLHDGVASQLTGIGILLGTLARRSPAEDSGLADDIREAQELVRESCDDVRRLSRGLAPAGLSGHELPAALERLADGVEEGVFEKGADLPSLEGDAAAHLYWIAQEATTNARKYAEADEIVIRLTREKGALVLEVEDDGRGFDASSVENGSLGLRTMRYRAELLDAAFTIASSRGEGTRVRCRLSA